MLLRISASNFLSLADRQELSLVASSLKGADSNVFSVPGSDLKILPSAVIYGANASGKTNFIEAFRFMCSAVRDSHKHGNPEGGVPRISFSLDASMSEKTSTFEADFLIDNVRHQYGFECDSNIFTSEWLYIYPQGKRRKIFDRNRDVVEFGSSFKGQKKIISDLMRPNSLFLSTATQNDHRELGRVSSFFSGIRFNRNLSASKTLINRSFKKSQIDKRAIDFLESIGTGVVGYRQSEVELSDDFKIFAKEFSTFARKHIGEAFVGEDAFAEEGKDVVIELAHEGAGGSISYFGLERESAGTRRLIPLISKIFKAIDEGAVLLVDELDASIHTHAAERIIDLFSDSEINKNGAQLIATTHDTNLLNAPCLRRDQIWFCEKNRIGESHVYSLADIKTRQGDNFEKGYLEGRYGAIPFSGALNLRGE